MKICPQCLKQYEDALDMCPDDGTDLRVFNDSATRVTGKILDGRWLVQKKFAEGGMGEVYVGQQVSMNRQVALKVLRPAMAASEEYVNRFFREANIASSIKHPNFVHIYDFGQERDLGILYLAMEYLEGQDLSDRVAEGRLALDHVLEIGIQVCSALSAAHEANIIHRDLKPENIFLVDSGGDIHVKVLDFGIAKDLGSTSNVTRTGQIFGTPEYMSPEQCQNFSTIDGRCDLYSLGCVMYELLTGRSPFHRDTVIATLLAQVQDTPPHLSKLDYAIPIETAEIVHRLLQKSPDKRFDNARLAKEALEAELLRLRARPDLIREFWESHRNTEEFDRAIDSGALTTKQRRTESQFISLDTLEHRPASPDDSDLMPLARRARWPWVAGLILIATVASAAALYSSPTDPSVARMDLMRALAEASDRIENAYETSSTRAHASHAELISSQIARTVAIMTTSLALAGEFQEPKDVTPSKRVQTPAKPAPDKAAATNPLLNIRTPASVEKRASRFSHTLKKCYALRPVVETNGEFVFRFRIQPDGSVDNVNVRRAEPDTPDIRDCIVQTVGQWKFAPSAGDAGVAYHERTVRFAFAQ